MTFLLTLVLVLPLTTWTDAYLEVQDTLLPNNPFVSIWNAPTMGCEHNFGVKLNLSYFDIVANKDHTFEGDEIVIFYDLGVFPRFASDKSAVNGGIPQLGNLTLHLSKLQHNIEQFIPKKTFTGLAVIDMEYWRPIFGRNNYNQEMKIYIEASLNLVRKEHPDWPEDKVRHQAADDFDSAARKFMLTTLQLCNQLRPQGKWGYYGFPNCYNYGTSDCSNGTKIENDWLAWMFENSGAIMPSIYLSKSGTVDDRRRYVYGQLKEALRVKGNNSRAAILPYSRFTYRDTDIFYSLADLNNTIQQSADAGLAGIALWGASASFRTKAQCEATRDYIDNTLGPMVKNITMFALNCSATICHSHGRCLKLDWSKQKSNFKLPDEKEEIGGLITKLNAWWHKFFRRIWNFVTGSIDVIKSPFCNANSVEKGVLERSLNHVQNRFGLKNSVGGRNGRGGFWGAFGCRCYSGWHGEFCQNSGN